MSLQVGTASAAPVSLSQITIDEVRRNRPFVGTFAGALVTLNGPRGSNVPTLLTFSK